MHALAFSSFNDRGYQSHIIEESYIKVTRLNRNNLLNPLKLGGEEEKPIDDKTIQVTTYHHHDMTLPKILSSNWDTYVLGKSHNTSFLYKKWVKQAFCRPQNLNDILVRASTSKKPQTTTETRRSMPPARNLCFPHNDMEHKPKKQVNTCTTDFFKSQGMRTSLITNS